MSSNWERDVPSDWLSVQHIWKQMSIIFLVHQICQKFLLTYLWGDSLPFQLGFAMGIEFLSFPFWLGIFQAFSPIYLLWIHLLGLLWTWRGCLHQWKTSAVLCKLTISLLRGTHRGTSYSLTLQLSNIDCNLFFLYLSGIIIWSHNSVSFMFSKDFWPSLFDVSANVW